MKTRQCWAMILVAGLGFAQAGYGAGADFDALYGFFKGHNPEYLADLKAFCEHPPKGG